MPKMKKIIKESLEDRAKMKNVYHLPKLSQYFNVKDHVTLKYKRDIVCKCTCTHIEWV